MIEKKVLDKLEYYKIQGMLAALAFFEEVKRGLCHES